MQIEYFGHSCFRITAQNGVRIVTDPYVKVGYSLPTGLQADVVTISHGHFDHNYVEGVQTHCVWDKEDAYALQGITATTIATDHDEQGGRLRGKNLLFKFFIDGMTVCHFGDLGQPCTPALCEKIGKIDVALLPIGGTYTIDAKQAQAYIEALQPHVVIPMHYRPKDGTIDISSPEEFLRLFEGNVRRAEPKHTLHVQKSEIEECKTQIIFMEKEG